MSSSHKKQQVRIDPASKKSVVDFSGLDAPSPPLQGRTPLKEVLGEYGLAGEPLVRKFIGNCNMVELDQMRAQDNTPQQNRDLVRAYHNLYLIEEDENVIQQQKDHHQFRQAHSFLQEEKKKVSMAKEKAEKKILTLRDKVKKLKQEAKDMPKLPEVVAKVSDLESKVSGLPDLEAHARRVPGLEQEVKRLEDEVARLSLLESAAAQQKLRANDFEAKLARAKRDVVDIYLLSLEFEAYANKMKAAFMRQKID